jgi:phosphoglycerate dehydrogenase-like enzyme
MLVANTFHHEQSIAEYVAAAAVMLRRDFLMQDRELRRNIWATSVYDAAIPQPRALGGAHIGYVGFVHIGRRVEYVPRLRATPAPRLPAQAEWPTSAVVRWCKSALYDALAGGVIRAAAIDVW